MNKKFFFSVILTYIKAHLQAVEKFFFLSISIQTVYVLLRYHAFFFWVYIFIFKRKLQTVEKYVEKIKINTKKRIVYRYQEFSICIPNVHCYILVIQSLSLSLSFSFSHTHISTHTHTFLK